MVNEFCGFKHGVIGTDKMPADTTLNNMKKADLIKLLHTAQHNYESLMWFYNNAVNVNMAKLNNNGWIPCRERLPKEATTYQVTEEVIINSKTQYVVDIRLFGTEGEWLLPSNRKVIAWMPLPAPYTEGE